MVMDVTRARREQLRWAIMHAVNQRRPEPLSESILNTVLKADFAPVGSELRCEMDYLRDKELLTIENEQATTWAVSLTTYGIDVVTYVANAPVGIQRPERDAEMELAALYDLRWRILRTLMIGRLRGVNESVVLQVVMDLQIGSSAGQLRQELCYLEAKDLVKIDRKRAQNWVIDLTGYGVDVVEGAKNTPRGIERVEG